MNIGGYLFIALLIVITLTSAVSAATIQGSIYNLELDRVQDTIVEIDTDPQQTYVAKNGTYSFHVPAGTYILKAKMIRDREVIEAVEENITVTQEGTYVLDLILFPFIDPEELELNISDIEIEEEIFEKEGMSIELIIGIVILILVAIFFMKPRKKQEELSDEEEEKILNIIKDHKRITQKEIRKLSPLSEGKISLIIADLESKGKIRKIKKGRGNIIILK